MSHPGSTVRESEQKKVKIVCRNIPPQYAKKHFIKTHFETFGIVVNVLVNATKGVGSVEFADPDDALNAKQNGSMLAPDVSIKLFWQADRKTVSDVNNKPTAGASTRKLFGWTKSITQAPPRHEPTAGLYDDLPPASESDENNQQLGSSRLFGKPMLKAVGDDLSSTSSETSAKVLFGKIVQPMKTSASGASSETSAKVLFGKMVQPKKISSFSKPVSSTVVAEEETPQTVTAKVLFGKPVMQGDSQEEETTHEPVKKTFWKQKHPTLEQRNQPKLFGKSQGPSHTSALSRLGERESPSPPPPYGLQSPENRKDSSPVPYGALSTVRERDPSPTPSRATPSPAPTSIQEEVSWSLPRPMQSLSQTAANTAAERYAVLEKRDKILRQGQTRQQDISKARATVGICPDMCPERERYIREERRRVHVYEMIPGTESHPKIDHARAVKEYSRSSADQEEPLPNELRPASALSKTMAYLCNNILDIGGDGAWSDWFDFLWNRTRAIRKDITQQHLCDPIAVGLVEKCARFHIFSGARLCMEDSMTFDEKINNENLTKCLQTLKELYADLLKKGIFCPNEAEFRGYMVLMNLNQGDTQRDAQQLRAEIRNSPEINFALSAYSALDQRNYVKFFKLVNSTTFMNACILHRYFTQIRYEALKIILNAYTAGRGKANITYSQLCGLLQFENMEEADMFMVHYGFSIEFGVPELNREFLVEPEANLGKYRSNTLVENKLITTVGEAVYGSPVPGDDINPTFSFDDEGYFTGILQASCQQEDIEDPTEEEGDHMPSPSYTGQSNQPSTEHTVLPPINQIDNAIVKDVAKELILEVLDERLQDIAKQCTADNQLEIYAMQKIVEIITAETVVVMAREISQQVIMEERRKKRAILVGEACQQIVEDLTDETIQEEAEEQARETYRICQDELHKQQNDRVSKELHSNLLCDDLRSLIKDVVDEVYQQDVVERLKELEACFNGVVTIQCRRFFKIWKRNYERGVHRLNTLKGFPAAPMFATGKRPSDQRLENKVLHLDKRSRLSLEPIPNIVNVQLDTKLRFAVVERHLRIALSNRPVNIGRILEQLITESSVNSECLMKLIVHVPEADSEQNKLLTEWTTLKLSSGAVEEPVETSTQGQLLSLYSIPSLRNTIQVCVRSYKSTNITNHTFSTWGANCAIYLLSYTEDISEDFWLQEAQNLLQFIRSKPSRPALPLLVISPLDIFKEEVQNNLGVYDLLDNELISDVRVDRLDNTEAYTSMLVESIKWLAQHRPAAPQIIATDLRSYLDTGFTRDFKCPLYENQKNRVNEDRLCLSPNSIIDMYNSVLTRLSHTLMDDSLLEISWPPTEFYLTSQDTTTEPWNCGNQLASLNKVVTSYYLPKFKHQNAYSDKWETACSDIWLYVESLTEDYPMPAGPLVSRVEKLLAKTESSFAARCRKKFHCERDCKPFYVNAPWTDLFVYCVDYILSGIDDERLINYTEMEGSDDHVLDEAWLQAAINEEGVSMSETMETALLESRREPDRQVPQNRYDDAEESFFPEDLSSSIHDELDASKIFQAKLEAMLQGENAEVVHPGARVADDEDEAMQTIDLIAIERKRNAEFELFLRNALVD